tara:strand:+ start:3568 stop:3801 length:234 start_codon:yes stop_codon:yes gene_type:complete
MSDQQLKDLQDYWKRRSINEGFTLLKFREHQSKYIDKGERCEMTLAVTAKLAYKSLCSERDYEHRLVMREMENVRWF